MTLKRLTRQGALVVMRDENGDIVKNPNGSVAAVPLAKDAPPRSWREALRHLTNNGEDMFVNLLNLANGVPYVPKHNGLEMDPVVPSPEVRRAANVDLSHMLHGKPVAQTEVLAAEKDTAELERYRATDIDSLWEAVKSDPETLKRLLSLNAASLKREALTALPAVEEDGDE